MTQQEMKQKYAVVILLALICASGLTSFKSYRVTERVVTEDMTCALTKALAEQQSDFISTDTIRSFNGTALGPLLLLALSQASASRGVWGLGLF